MSLRKNLGVTVIFLSSFEAFVLRATTTHVIKTVPPNKMQTDFTASASSPPTAEMLLNTSGAPFPKARRVTPAKDSDIPNLTVMYSKAGER